MSVLWNNIGFIRYPLLLSFLAILALALWSAVKLFRANGATDLATKAWLDAILFWGGFAVITGVLGTLIGMIIATQSVEAMGEVSTTMIFGGIKVALLSATVGVMILAMAALLWFVLQLRWRLLVAREAGLAE